MLATTCRLAACVFFFAATAAQAASDPQRIAELLGAAATATGKIALAYEAATADGDNVTITGLTVTAADGSAVVIPAVVIDKPEARHPGGFAATRIAFDNGIATADGGAAEWRTAVVEDVIVPSPDEVKARAKIRPFRKLSMGGVIITGPDVGEPIDIAALAIEIGEVRKDSPSAILVKATAARLPAAIITNPIGSAVIAMLGYSEFLADVTIDGDYDTKADTVTIQSLTIEAANIGRIAMAAKFSGLSFRGLSDPTESAAARAAARLDNLTVRFEDGGVVRRMLDMQAGLLGGTRDEVRAQLVDGALPFALSFVDNERFRDRFLAAAATFLEDPQSLTITVMPNAPVPLGQVWRAALRTPLALPDLLGPDVAANN